MNATRVILVFVFAACGVANGCAHHDTTASTEEQLPKIQTHWDETPLKIDQPSTAVAQGGTPLVFIFIAGGPIHVTDITSKVVIATGTVPDQTLVRVDDRHGVIAGDVTLLPGPLIAGHEYAIFADPTTSNVMRHGIGPPRVADAEAVIGRPSVVASVEEEVLFRSFAGNLRSHEAIARGQEVQHVR